jgi:hypothetical protein
MFHTIFLAVAVYTRLRRGNRAALACQLQTDHTKSKAETVSHILTTPTDRASFDTSRKPFDRVQHYSIQRKCFIFF